MLSFLCHFERCEHDRNEFIGRLQSTVRIGIAFAIGAPGLILWCSLMLTLIDIGFSLLLVIVSIVLRNKAAADFLARVILTGHVFYFLYEATAVLGCGDFL